MEDLKPEWRLFCQEYIFDWNGTRAYQAAYPDAKYDSASVNATKLLRNAKIQSYIEEIQKDLEKQAGLSRLKVLGELKKIAFTSIAHLHNTWITRKEFEELTEDQKDCISEIQTKIIPTKHGDIEEVKVKLFDKHKAIDQINKMLGYNEPDKVDLTSKGQKISEMSTEELIKRAEAAREIEQNKE